MNLVSQASKSLSVKIAQHVAPEFTTVVAVNRIHQPMKGPGCGNAMLAEPSIFRQDGVREAEA